MTESKSLCYVNKAHLIRQDHLDKSRYEDDQGGYRAIASPHAVRQNCEESCGNLPKMRTVFHLFIEPFQYLGDRLGISFAHLLKWQKQPNVSRTNHWSMTVFEEMQREPM
jgi:threonyl-tRNA synthetase